MKVLFVVKSKAIETLGVMYLSAVVKNCGHDAKIVDINGIYDVIPVIHPDIIAYSVMTGDGPQFRRLNSNLKRVMDFTSIFGGPDPTFFPEPYEQDDDINMVCKGEGENFMADVLGSTNRYPNIDSISWPDRADFAHMKIRDFITTRGCGYGKCGYCFTKRWEDMFPDIPKIRTRSAKDVVAEVAAVNPQFAYFQDSTFAISIKWLREFKDKYNKTPFHCHLRPTQLVEERVLLLHESNCISLRIALESASKRLRKIMNRPPMENEEVMAGIRLLKKWDIRVMIQNIIGIPYGTIEEDLETLEFNIGANPSYAWVSIFTPYPGTEMGDMCKKEGIYRGNYSDISDSFFDKSVLEFSAVYKEQLICLQRIWALCCETGYMPKSSELTIEQIPGIVHRAMRKLGDHRLYGGVI
jgi:radical SAM superfamily enzyme YgiQ (UPF0313 family)